MNWPCQRHAAAIETVPSPAREDCSVLRQQLLPLHPFCTMPQVSIAAAEVVAKASYSLDLPGSVKFHFVSFLNCLRYRSAPQESRSFRKLFPCALGSGTDLRSLA